jgi:hypothetical protein
MIKFKDADLDSGVILTLTKIGGDSHLRNDEGGSLALKGFEHFKIGMGIPTSKFPYSTRMPDINLTKQVLKRLEKNQILTAPSKSSTVQQTGQQPIYKNGKIVANPKMSDLEIMICNVMDFATSHFQSLTNTSFVISVIGTGQTITGVYNNHAKRYEIS